MPLFFTNKTPKEIRRSFMEYTPEKRTRAQSSIEGMLEKHKEQYDLLMQEIEETGKHITELKTNRYKIIQSEPEVVKNERERMDGMESAREDRSVDGLLALQHYLSYSPMQAYRDAVSSLDVQISRCSWTIERNKEKCSRLLAEMEACQKSLEILISLIEEIDNPTVSSVKSA